MFVYLFGAEQQQQILSCFCCAARYGPRTRSVEFSDEGQLVCDVKFAPFATGTRRERGQVSSNYYVTVSRVSHLRY